MSLAVPTAMNGADASMSGGVKGGVVRRSTGHPVRLILPWPNSGISVPAFVARSLGDWDEHGLDVGIDVAGGSTDALDKLVDGSADFAIAAVAAAIHRRAACGPLVAIAACGDDSRMAVCALSDGPISRPADLAGRRLGLARGSAEGRFLPVYARLVGLDLARVDIVELAADEREAALARHEVDAIAGFAGSMLPVLTSFQMQARTFLFRDAGLDLGGHALLTRASILSGSPQVCADVASGLLHAIRYALLNPEEALALVRMPTRHGALAAIAQMRFAVALANNALLPAVRDHGLGWSDPSRYDTLAELVSPEHDQPRCLASEMFTNRFAQDTPMPRAEWLAANAKAAPFLSPVR